MPRRKLREGRHLSDTLPRRSSSLLLSLAMAGRIMAFIARMHVVPFFPEYMDIYNLSYAQVGLLLSVFYVAYSVCLVPVGMAADYFSSRNLFAWGWIVVGLGMLGTTFAPSYTMILLSRAITALGVSMLYPPSLKLVTVAFDRQRRGKAMGLLEIGVGVGMLISMTVFPMLAAVIAFTTMFAAAATICLPLAGMTITLPDIKTATDHPVKTTERSSGLLRERSYWYLIIATIFLYFVMNGMLGWIPTYLEYAGLSKAKAGLITGLLMAGQVISSLPAGGLSDRIGRRTPIIQAGAILMAVAPASFLFLGDQAQSLILLAIITAFTGVGLGFAIAPSSTLAAELFGSHRAATVISSTAAAGQLGSAITGWLFGRIVDLTASFLYVWLICLIALFIRIVTMELVKEPRRLAASAAKI